MVSPYLRLPVKSEEDVRNMRRTVVVPIRAGLANGTRGGHLYLMSNGNYQTMTPGEVNDVNLRSIEAGEGGGCLPAEHRSIFGFGAVYEPSPRRTSWWPGIFAAVITFGAMAGFFTAEWWIPAVLRMMERM